MMSSTLESGSTMPEDAILCFKNDSSKPIRILVESKTHLIPGNDFHENVFFILDSVCQHHWNRDFDLDDRWNTYDADFGY